MGDILTLVSCQLGGGCFCALKVVFAPDSGKHTKESNNTAQNRQREKNSPNMKETKATTTKSRIRPARSPGTPESGRNALPNTLWEGRRFLLARRAEGDNRLIACLTWARLTHVHETFYNIVPSWKTCPINSAFRGCCIHHQVVSLTPPLYITWSSRMYDLFNGQFSRGLVFYLFFLLSFLACSHCRMLSYMRSLCASWVQQILTPSRTLRWQGASDPSHPSFSSMHLNPAQFRERLAQFVSWAMPSEASSLCSSVAVSVVSPTMLRVCSSSPWIMTSSSPRAARTKHGLGHQCTSGWQIGFGQQRQLRLWDVGRSMLCYKSGFLSFQGPWVALTRLWSARIHKEDLRLLSLDPYNGCSSSRSSTFLWNVSFLHISLLEPLVEWAIDHLALDNPTSPSRELPPNTTLHKADICCIPVNCPFPIRLQKKGSYARMKCSKKIILILRLESLAIWGQRARITRHSHVCRGMFSMFPGIPEMLVWGSFLQKLKRADRHTGTKSWELKWLVPLSNLVINLIR